MQSFLNMKDVIISDTKHLNNKIKEIAKQGKKKIHVVADFDRTLTTAFVQGKKVPSLISILRDGNYLSEDYANKAHELFNYYHAIEINPSVPIEEKKKLMKEWWMKHFDLLIKSRLNRKDIQKVIESGKARLRKGAVQFLDFLHEHDIPLVIFSSSGLGVDSISLYLEKKKKLYKNIHIISNVYEWDENGNAIKVKEPIIHCMNKDETSIQDYPVFSVIKNRRNVILLGDSFEDLGMVKGFKYDNLIAIGFLNEEIDENLEAYKKTFDIVITRDGDMNYVNDLFKKLI